MGWVGCLTNTRRNVSALSCLINKCAGWVSPCHMPIGRVGPILRKVGSRPIASCRWVTRVCARHLTETALLDWSNQGGPEPESLYRKGLSPCLPRWLGFLIYMARPIRKERGERAPDPDCPTDPPHSAWPARLFPEFRP